MSKEAQEKTAEELPFPGEEMFARLNYQVDLMSPARGSVIEAYRMAQQDMLEAGYRKLPKDKPPLFDKDDEARIEIARYMLVPDPLPKIKESHIACFLLGSQVQREADIGFYAGTNDE